MLQHFMPLGQQHLSPPLQTHTSSLLLLLLLLDANAHSTRSAETRLASLLIGAALASRVQAALANRAEKRLARMRLFMGNSVASGVCQGYRREHRSETVPKKLSVLSAAHPDNPQGGDSRMRSITIPDYSPEQIEQLLKKSRHPGWKGVVQYVSRVVVKVVLHQPGELSPDELQELVSDAQEHAKFWVESYRPGMGTKLTTWLYTKAAYWTRDALRKLWNRKRLENENGHRVQVTTDVAIFPPESEQEPYQLASLYSSESEELMRFWAARTPAERRVLEGVLAEKSAQQVASEMAAEGMTLPPEKVRSIIALMLERVAVFSGLAVFLFFVFAIGMETGRRQMRSTEALTEPLAQGGGAGSLEGRWSSEDVMDEERLAEIAQRVIAKPELVPEQDRVLVMALAKAFLRERAAKASREQRDVDQLLRKYERKNKLEFDQLAAELASARATATDAEERRQLAEGESAAAKNRATQAEADATAARSAAAAAQTAAQAADAAAVLKKAEAVRSQALADQLEKQNQAFQAQLAALQAKRKEVAIQDEIIDAAEEAVIGSAAPQQSQADSNEGEPTPASEQSQDAGTNEP